MKRLLLALALLWPVSATAQILPPSPQSINAVFSSACTAATCATWALGTANSITLAVSGSFSGTLTFYGSSDGGQTYFAVAAVNLSTGASASTTTATGQFAIANSGLTQVQVRFTAYSTGGANITAARGYATARWLSPFLYSLTVNPGPLTIQSNGLVTTSTDGLNCTNSTAATVGVPVQISPRCPKLSGTAWDTDDAVSRTVSFFAEVLPASAASVTGIWKLGYIDPVTSALTYPASVTSDGGLTSTAYIGTSSTGILLFGARSRITSPADGQLNATNTAGGNTYLTTITDWGTTLSAEAVSYAQDGVQNIGTARGMLSVTIGTANATCVYILSGSATTELSDPDTICTVTKGNAATVNISWQTDHFEIENKIAGTRTIRAVLIGG